jgi:hypothetical protein
MLPPRFQNIWSYTLLTFSLLFSSAGAETITAKYKAEWNNIDAGSMTVLIDESAAGNYKYQILLDSSGLVKTFTKYRSENTAKGKIVSGKPVPESYLTEWWRKKGDEHQIINIEYKDGGNNVQETATPPEKRHKRPIVEGKYKNNTLDPVSSALYARYRIKEIVEAGKAADEDISLPKKFTMPVFDGRRRFNVEITINGYKKKNYQGKTQDLLEVVFFRTPVNGFNDKELKRMKEQDPTVVFYLNNDYIPVMGSGSAPFGKANFTLVSLCQSVDIACK